jgi:hypothetical protein
VAFYFLIIFASAMMLFSTFLVVWDWQIVNPML